jgi:metal transporter CNNM
MYTFFIIVLLLAISALCSGLNVSLMSLNIADIKRRAKLGNKNAIKVLKLREHSHLSLASILLTNVGVISATSLVLGEEYNGFIAGLLSTVLIVIFSEVIPQAYFARNALKMTAFLAPVLNIMIIATYPVAKPISMILDKVFGLEKHNLHSRHELGLIIADHIDHKDSELDDDEVEIIRGALRLSETKVIDIMTPIDNVFWLKPSRLMDDKLVDKIKDQSYSRIPILNPDLSDTYGLLLMKDMVDVDFDNNSRKVSDLKLHKLNVVGSRTALDTMFRKFIAAKAHLMAVEKNDKIVGVVTIEDLFEQLIGQEIEDETDNL